MKCANCKIREATEKWVGQGSIMDYTHGNYQMWCKKCIARAQLTYARKQLRKLPLRIKKLEKEVERFK
jgi:hypothetical protein